MINKNFKLNKIIMGLFTILTIPLMADSNNLDIKIPTNDKIKISPERAKTIAKEHSNFSDDATVEIKLDEENDKIVYELRIYDLNKELEYEIDAQDGKILEFSQEEIYRFSYRHNPYNERTYENKSFLTKDEIKKLALQKVKNSTENNITKFKTDINGGVFVYEIEIIVNGTRYEIDLNAQTGEIISWEEETIVK